MVRLSRVPVRTLGFGGSWLGQVRLGQPIPAPQPQTVYPKSEPGESLEVAKLALDGARLTAEIGLPKSVIDYYQAHGLVVPGRQTVKALIDSGASISGIRPAVAQAAGLIQTSSVGISGVLGMENRPVYIAAVNLPDYNVNFDVLSVAGIDLPQQEIGMLIGRDVLRHVKFTYDGNSGNFTLEQG